MKYLLAAVTVIMALFAISLNVAPADASEQAEPCPLPQTASASVTTKAQKNKPECLHTVGTTY